MRVLAGHRNEEIMAFDGVTIACVISELKKELIGGRLYKIAQPENDELLLTIKGKRDCFCPPVLPFP